MIRFHTTGVTTVIYKVWEHWQERKNLVPDILHYMTS